MQNLQIIPFQIQQMLDAELARDETLRWTAQPKCGRFARQALPIFLFGIPWTAFAVFWICSAADFQVPDSSEGWHLFPLLGLPFVLIGLGMLSSPLWMIRKARRTAYAITNKRAIIFESGWGSRIRSFYPKDLADLTRNQKADGSGDIIFKYEISYGSRDHTYKKEVGFLGIDNVRDIEQMLRQIVA